MKVRDLVLGLCHFFHTVAHSMTSSQRKCSLFMEVSTRELLGSCMLKLTISTFPSGASVKYTSLI